MGAKFNKCKLFIWGLVLPIFSFVVYRVYIQKIFTELEVILLLVVFILGLAEIIATRNSNKKNWNRDKWR